MIFGQNLANNSDQSLTIKMTKLGQNITSQH